MLRRYSAFFATLVFATVPLRAGAMSSPPIYDYSAVQASVAQVQKATTTAQISAEVQTLLNRYSLRLSTTCMSDPAFTCSDITAGDIPAYKQMATLFIQEWSKYPPEWTKATNLQTINLIKDYKYNYMGNKQARAAAPMNYLRTMIYDIGYANSELYMRHVIHHEYVHYFEEFYYGDVYHQDATWASYNTPGFKYGNGGGSCYEEGNSCVTGEHPAQGFVTGYAMSGIEEDKAELYGYLFETSEYKKLQEWMQTDAVLKRKHDYYVGLIGRVVSGMDATYFANIHSNAPVRADSMGEEPVMTPDVASPDDYSGADRVLRVVIIALGVYIVGGSLFVVAGLGIWWLVSSEHTKKNSHQ